MLAIIGTAGRDKTKPMTYSLWQNMVQAAIDHVQMHNIKQVVSGGAAWADHVAVYLAYLGLVDLVLHLPAPLTSKGFIGPFKSAGSTANYYHEKFSNVIREDTLLQLYSATQLERTQGTFQPESVGMGAFFKRNSLVAKDATSVLAFTWGEGDIPEDGGTLDTWIKIQSSHKKHISLHTLL